MKKHINTAPPRWPLQLLRFFIKRKYVEEIEGDMEEVYRENLERYPVRKAKRLYTLEMVRLLRPALISNLKTANTTNTYPMLKNYFKTSLRSLLKNPLTSFINIFGLSVAIGICIVVYSFLEFDHRIDHFHENKNSVYLVTYFGDMDGTLQEYGRTPRPLGEMLRIDLPQVKKVCRIEDGNVIVKRDEHVFAERVRYTDPTFLEMFTFPLKWGTSKSLTDANSIILSTEMSEKYFGEENPIGQQILIKFNEERSKLFKVTGVAEPFPDAHIIEFSFLLNFENLKMADPAYNFNDWSAFINGTLIQVDNPSDLEVIKEKMKKYKALQNEVQEGWAVSAFAFHSIADLHLNSQNIREGISYDYSQEGRIGLPVIALFMLALACFNYINIAIVSASRRLKEIGVRKVIGANRGKVVLQFLAENVVVTTFALIVGVALAITIFLPWFIQINRQNMELSLTDINLWLFLLAMLLFTALASGIYPAFYISKFEATKIFRGSVQFGKKNPLTKVFLCVQLVLACITITGAVMFTQNSSYQYNRSWGYNQTASLYVQVQDGLAFEQLEARLLQDPNVVEISGSKHHLGKAYASAVVRMPDHQYEVNELSIDANYFETMELHLIQGRNFQEHAEADKSKIIVNELFVKNLSIKDPINHEFEIDSMRYEVIGVVKDFHINSFYEKIQPTIFTLADQEEYRYITMKVKKEAQKETLERVKILWGSLFPETPFQGGFQEDIFHWFFEDVDTGQNFMQVIASIAVLLASLGLYGLVTLNVSGRVKEFSIRKILGASLKTLAANISKQYVLLTIVAMVIGAPVSYIMIEGMLNMLYAYPMPMTLSGIAISLAILMLVLSLVVFIQVRIVTKANPVEGLKE